MLIACPACATTYDLAAARMGAGRNVRCARCRTVWFARPADALPAQARAQTRTRASEPALAGADAGGAGGDWAASGPPSDDAMGDDAATTAPGADDVTWTGSALADPGSIAPPMLEAPPLAPADGFDDASGGMPGAAEDADKDADKDAASALPTETPTTDDGPHEDIETIAARRGQIVRARRRRRRASWLPAAIALMAVITFGLLAGRERLVRTLPSAASFYALLGLPVNLRGLAFEGLRTTEEVNDEVPFLVVRGEIVNVGSRRVEVPRLRFALRNADAVEVYSWTVFASRDDLGAGERLEFVSRLAAPPADAHDVMLRFFHRRDLDTAR